MIRILSIATLSLGLFGGAAIAEPFDASGFSPAPSTGFFGSSDIGTMRSDRAIQSTTTSVNCGQSSKEGGGEPSSVDSSSPSIVC